MLSKREKKMLYFQDIVASLSSFWTQHGCIVVTPYDVEKGAGTSNPFTLLRSLGPEPFRSAYIEPCRRPTDGRYGTNPNRMQHYFQFQAILKPSPDDIVDIYIDSLRAIGLDLSQHDIRFVHDDWENPTVGAWGLGWEVWLNGMEITQFTYFQAAAGFSLPTVTGEITYGIERIAMYLQNVDSIFDIQWNEKLTYGDLFFQNEVQWSTYNFESQDEKMWMRHFEDFQNETKRLISLDLSIPAYDFVLKSSHAFNMLDAKGVISVSERASYIAKIRELSKGVAESYLTFREKLGFPLVEEQEPEQPVAETEPSFAPPKAPKEEFVFEIGTEELPATFVPIGIEQLSKAFTALLAKNDLSYSSLKVVGAPRRLAVIVEGLCTEKSETIVEKRGPSIETAWNSSGELMPAGQGFLRSVALSPCTLQQVEQGKIPELSIREIRSQRYLFATIKTPSIYTSQILHEELSALIKSLEFPKMMRWGSYKSAFARPIRWILSLLGEEVIPVQFERVQSDRWSMGHRQLAPRKIELSTASQYESALEKAYVLVDQHRRRDRLISQLNEIEQRSSLSAVHKEKVLKQLIHLSEWPQAVAVTFDDALLDAPKEVLISEMVEHQKYIPLVDQSGELCNKFILVADNHPTDLIKRGNIKVLSARLADGSFLWKEDIKNPFENLREKLRTIIYQRTLGTLWQKTERLETLVQSLHSHLPNANLSHATKAAQLSKADLASLTVGEFPELQGIIGELIAKQQGLPQEVATAIYEHWLPQHEQGSLPESPEGTLLALADKFDTLTGFFAIGMQPSSSSDPYALRRQAIGIIRIVLAKHIHLSLHDHFAKILNLFEPDIFTKERSEIIDDLSQFVTTRARALFADMGYKRESIDAVLCKQHDDIYDAFLRLQALEACSSGDLSAFLEVLKRCYGQADLSLELSIDCSKLESEAERKLHTLLEQTEKETLVLAKEHKWGPFLNSLILLKQPIDDLFSEVKVLADDPIIRHNRLSLLRKIIDICSTFADGKKLSG